MGTQMTNRPNRPQAPNPHGDDRTDQTNQPPMSADTQTSSCDSWRKVARIMVALCAALTVPGCGQTTVNEGIAPTESATTTVTSPFDPATDVSDLRNLMAASTHVFSGRVDGLAGSKTLNSFPETQYTVTIGVQLKGQASTTVIVNQQGGTRNGTYMSLGGDRPLTTGQWYLFATRTLQSEGWFTLIPVYGDVKISEDQATNPNSEPLAAAAAAHNKNLQGAPRPSITAPVTPSLTFPIPAPGDQHAPPPSPPQPTR